MCHLTVLEVTSLQVLLGQKSNCSPGCILCRLEPLPCLFRLIGATHIPWFEAPSSIQHRLVGPSLRHSEFCLLLPVLLRCTLLENLGILQSFYSLFCHILPIGTSLLHESIYGVGGALFLPVLHGVCNTCLVLTSLTSFPRASFQVVQVQLCLFLDCFCCLKSFPSAPTSTLAFLGTAYLQLTHTERVCDGFSCFLFCMQVGCMPSQLAEIGSTQQQQGLMWAHFTVQSSAWIN